MVRRVKTALVLSFAIAASMPLVAQKRTKAHPYQLASKDATALKLITSMNAACGWTTPPTSIVATGTTTYQGNTETAKLEAIPGYLRTERPEAGSVLIVHGGMGELKTNGAAVPLSVGEAFGIAPMMFPFYSEISSALDPAVSITLGKTGQVDGHPVQIVNLTSSAALLDGLDILRQASSQISVAISTDTNLPLQIDFQRWFSQEQDHVGQVSAFLSDFRNVNGVLIPFGYSEEIEKQTTLTIQFESVDLNVPIPPSDFNLD